MRLQFAKTAADPLITGTNVQYGTTVQLTLDREATGWSTTELVDQIVALADYLKASTNAAATKFVGGEN
jgi:sugar/nucleoside kinase (ribokinase family)